MKKNIVIAAIIIACLALAVGLYFWLGKSSGPQEKAVPSSLGAEFALPGEIAGLDLNLSPIEDAELPSVDLNIGLDSSGLDLDLTDSLGSLDLGGVAAPSVEAPATGDLNLKNINPNLNIFQPAAQKPSAPSAPAAQNPTPSPSPSQSPAAAPAEYQPSAEDCSQFAAAPSCDYVPADSRDICRKCKGQ